MADHACVALTRRWRGARQGVDFAMSPILQEPPFLRRAVIIAAGIVDAWLTRKVNLILTQHDGRHVRLGGGALHALRKRLDLTCLLGSAHHCRFIYHRRRLLVPISKLGRLRRFFTLLLL